MYLSDLFWSELVRVAVFIMLLPFYFAALNLSIYQSINLSINLSIYLPGIYLPICLYEVTSSFLKAVLSAETVPFIETVYREIQIQLEALCELYWVVYTCTVIENGLVRSTKFTFCPYVLKSHYSLS